MFTKLFAILVLIFSLSLAQAAFAEAQTGAVSAPCAAIADGSKDLPTAPVGPIMPPIGTATTGT